MSYNKKLPYINKDCKQTRYINKNTDDRRYSCECIVIVKNIDKLIDDLQIPTDTNHKQVYIVKSEFIKKHITEMRFAHKNKMILCDYLIEVKYDENNNKIVNKYTNIEIEVTYNCPNDTVIPYIPNNTYVLCASFGKITTHPRVQFGMTEGAKVNELHYKNKQFVYKPLNYIWKYKTSNRGVAEEFGLVGNFYWKCINEQLYNWNKDKWVATLITTI